MRQKRKKQMNLFHTSFKSDIGRDLEMMSQILDETPKVLNRVYQDLVGTKKSDAGRMGMTAEKVLRCGILRGLVKFGSLGQPQIGQGLTSFEQQLMVIIGPL